MKRTKKIWRQVELKEFMDFFHDKIKDKPLNREDSFEREETVFYLKNPDGTNGDIVGRVNGFGSVRKFSINSNVEKRYVN